MDVDGIFDRIYPSLYRYLYRLTGDGDAAEDAAQEAFVRLLRQDLPSAEARPWLFAVATNLVRDGARRDTRRARLLEGAPAGALSPALTPTPDDVVAGEERIAAVRSVLGRLPARDREILLMREEGFRYDEIAAAIDVAPGSVGTLLARALRRFSAACASEPAFGNLRETQS